VLPRFFRVPAWSARQGSGRFLSTTPKHVERICATDGSEVPGSVMSFAVVVIGTGPCEESGSPAHAVTAVSKAAARIQVLRSLMCGRLTMKTAPSDTGSFSGKKLAADQVEAPVGWCVF